MSFYDALGVVKDATQAQIKAAYRRKAKEAHPDAGGSPEAFSRLALAHRVLSDEDKRRQYDETGEVQDKPDQDQAKALELIWSLLSQSMNDQVIYRDLIGELRNSVGGFIRKNRDQAAETRRQIIKTEELRKRFAAKKGPDFIGQMIDSNIDAARKGLGSLDEQIATGEMALEILKDAEFRFDPPPTYQQPFGFSQFGNSTGPAGQFAGMGVR